MSNKRKAAEIVTILNTSEMSLKKSLVIATGFDFEETAEQEPSLATLTGHGVVLTL